MEGNRKNPFRLVFAQINFERKVINLFDRKTEIHRCEKRSLCKFCFRESTAKYL